MRYEIQKTIWANGEEITIILGFQENGVVLNIPTDPANSDYQAYLEHLTEIVSE